MITTGGMLDPAIDLEGEPFSYFWHPTDVIGALYAPVASEVTPEGYVYTGFGELMFFLGNPPETVNRRIKTLHKGYLPIVQYEIRRHGVRYSFEVVGADLGGELAGLPVNFVKVELRNESDEERTAFLSSAHRFMPPVDHLRSSTARYRFGQRFDLIPDEYTTGQTKFSPDWRYSFAGDALVRDGRILYVFPTDPKPYLAALALEDAGLRATRYFTGEINDNPNARLTLSPHTPMGLVMYRVGLNPGESRTLTFKIPLAPVAADSPAAAQVRGASHETEFRKTACQWDGLLQPVPMRFPEEKVQNYLLANTIFDLLAIDRVGDDYIINVNKFQYHRFYPGNGANMCVALDYMGLHDIAEKCLLHFRSAQRPDGSFGIPHHPADAQRFETTGYVLWVWERHYQLTRSESFLREVYPCVQRAVRSIQDITRTDPAGLMPPATVADDAMLANVRQTGMSLWTLIALKNAVRMAQAVENGEDEEVFGQEYDRYRDAFERHLGAQLEKSGGSIPPAMERTLDGNRWDDLLLLYPEVLFDPFDPRVTATIGESRQAYAEGILGFGLQRAVGKTEEAGWPGMTRDGLGTVRQDSFVFDDTRLLHYWQTPNNAQNALVRGTAEDQELAVRDMYALLLHTTSTHAPQEFGTIPWSTRDYESPHNILPDGAASGKTIELLRNMLVREYNDQLVLFSALSPAWLQPGKTIEVAHGPTEFGPVNVKLSVDSTGGWDVRLSNRFWQQPNHVIVRVPWFYEVEYVEADGQSVQPSDGQLRLSPATEEVRVRGRVKPDTPALSFEQTVEDYKREYRRRYDEFLRTGLIQP